MIPAKKSPWFDALFARHVRARMRRAFEGVHVRGGDEARLLAERSPLLVVSNHTAWWDPLVAIHLSHHVLRADGYAMMDAANLARLPFFRKVGAFGVDLAGGADGARAIRYAAQLLDRPGRMVWVFAQGRERPVTEPVAFRGGSAGIARVARAARVVPVGLRYELAGTERPSVWVSIGEPFEGERDVERGRARQEEAVARELARIERAVRGDAEGFARVLDGSRSWLAALAERALALLTRDHDAS